MNQMIIRIFKAQVPSDLQEEFELKFREISVPLVKNQKGMISLEIGKPSSWNPEEFIMISKWKNEDDIEEFAGKNWNQAFIPHGMEKYISYCSVSHHYHIDL